MKNSTFKFATNCKINSDDYVFVGTEKQAEAFLQIMHGYNEDISVVDVGKRILTFNDMISRVIILDDLIFICDKNDLSFECLYESSLMFSGKQDNVSGKMIIDGEGEVPNGEVDIKRFCEFLGFEHFAICETCNNTGSYDSASMPESKIVECDCPDVIFQYE